MIGEETLKDGGWYFLNRKDEVNIPSSEIGSKASIGSL